MRSSGLDGLPVELFLAIFAISADKVTYFRNIVFANRRTELDVS